MKPITNTNEANSTGDQKHVRRFKNMLLIIGVVASIGQLAFTLLYAYSRRSDAYLVSFVCSLVLGISFVVQIFVLPVLTLCLAGGTTLQTERARWLLYGAALLGIQAVLLGVQFYQVYCWTSLR